MAALDKQEIKTRVIAVVTDKLSLDPTTISDSSTLQNLGADSLDMVEIIMQLEETFDVSIDDEKAEKLETLSDVVEYIYLLLGEK